VNSSAFFAGGSGNQLLDYAAVNVSQEKVAAGIAVGKPRVVETEELE
jgi:hypothetical protein